MKRASKRRLALLRALLLTIGIVPLAVYAVDPVIDTNAGLIVDEGGTGVIGSAVLSSSDADSDPLTYTLTAAPTNGTLDLSGTGTLGTNDTFTQNDVDSGLLSYTHYGSETTTDNFEFEVSDGSVWAGGTFDITVNLINDNAPLLVTTSPAIAINENEALPITTADLQTTDGDIDAVLTYTLTTQPTEGIVFFYDGGNEVVVEMITSFTQADIDADMIYYFHLGADGDATDTFAFEVSDGGTSTPISDTFTINITGVNDSPKVEYDYYVAPVNTVLTTDAASGVLANDFDEEGDPITVTVITLPEFGTLTGDMVNADGSFDYTPNTDFSGLDAFVYEVSDGITAPSTGVAYISVAGAIPLNLDVFLQANPPAFPQFSWVGVDGATNYRVYVMDTVNGEVMDQTFAEADICYLLTCQVYTGSNDLPWWGLVNGEYQWWVGAQLADGSWVWSGGVNYNPANFTVDMPAPALPDPIQVNRGDGRVGIYFNYDINTLWVQVWVGPHPSGNYFEWHGLYDPNNPFTCSAGSCEIIANWDVPSATGLTVWMQAWGPGGFSTGGTVAAAWNQMSATVDGAGTTTPAADFDLPSTRPTAPTNIDVVDPAVLDPEIVWTGSANSTWYNLVLFNPTDNAILLAGWFAATDADCRGALDDPADYSCLIGTLDLDQLGLVTGETYDIYMQAWGPGGFSIGGDVLGLPAWNVGQFTYSYTPA